MRVVVVGSGGREHALDWVLRAGGADVALVGADPDVEALAERIAAREPNLVVIGPEAPLVAGLADVLRSRGLDVFGPSREAAALEGSKVVAKAFMSRWEVPTAWYSTFDNANDALAYLRTATAPIVVKDSGLAAGKGVTVAGTLEEAEAAVRAVFSGGAGAADTRSGARREVVVEERLSGRELTLMLLTDGATYRLLPTARDHKRLRDGEAGEMTGGMGVVAPVALADPALLATIEETVVKPVVAGLAAEGLFYRGVLYIGLMLTPDGPKVLEFNVRFGDPEAQAVLPLLASNAPELFRAVARGELATMSIAWRAAHAACVVMAAPGYPAAPVAGVPVSVPQDLGEGVMVFAGGLAPAGGPGEYVTSGGRALNVVGLGATAAEARASAYAAVERISFPGAQYRTDIGA